MNVEDTRANVAISPIKEQVEVQPKPFLEIRGLGEFPHDPAHASLEAWAGSMVTAWCETFREVGS